MDKMCGNKWEGNRVPLGERKLDCTLNEEPQNYISHFVGAYLFSKVHICDAKIAYLDDMANLDILPYGLHFFEVMSFTKIIKDVDG